MEAMQQTSASTEHHGMAHVRAPVKPIVFIVGTDEASDDQLAEKIQSMQLEVRRYQDANRFLNEASPSTPGCVISGMYMNGMSGLELQSVLKRSDYTWPIIFLAKEASVPLVVRAMRAGAVTFLVQPWREDEVCLHVQEALSLNDKARQEQARVEELTESFAKLSPQEENILDDIYRGMTNKQIAANMDLSLRTIESRRQRLFQKTGSASLPDLIKRYHEALILKNTRNELLRGEQPTHRRPAVAGVQ